MKTLLIYPKFPLSFWSYTKALELTGKKAAIPPLSLTTVAGILPQDWEFKLIDRTIRPATETEWEWAELVIISGMIVQQDDFHAQIREAKRRGIPVAVGGPYPSSTPEPLKEAGADYLILDEGEITLPMFVEALERGETEGIFRSEEKCDMTTSPVPRHDLLDLKLYESMSVQFSRGCPFQCEFCDIIVLYGRKPRTKNTSQILQELESLYKLGWTGNVVLVDDNFIGNKRNVKLLLKEIKNWQEQHNYPFSFYTEASVDLAKETELLELMVDCNFWGVFVGIETPDHDSLKLTKKYQNLRDPLVESINKITSSGIQVTGGFILGFDGEKDDVADSIFEFVQQTNIINPMLGILQAIPNTALWHRLEKEGRLLNIKLFGNQGALMNFVPERPMENIAQDYLELVWKLFEPVTYMERMFKTIMKINQNGLDHKHRSSLSPSPLELFEIIFFILWKYGIVLKTRWKFWSYLLQIFFKYPDWAGSFFIGCGQMEHFLEYRETAKERINQQLLEYKSSFPAIVKKEPENIKIASAMN